ncbi:GSCOCG00009039001-RA-CDS [Cotesia congregata]|uniref:Uncharacterized protein n=1 Tax=Cotesia congregata TaxID=51543 RepID=A0A8J2H8R2_COTCN|nr:GSCOCG00009039001-RA-CDS [Cotesia congregata]CAG5083271.1 Protein of unknown function [Cotesia congregata]
MENTPEIPNNNASLPDQLTTYLLKLVTEIEKYFTLEEVLEKFPARDFPTLPNGLIEQMMNERDEIHRKLESYDSQLEGLITPEIKDRISTMALDLTEHRDIIGNIFQCIKFPFHKKEDYVSDKETNYLKIADYVRKYDQTFNLGLAPLHLQWIQEFGEVPEASTDGSATLSNTSMNEV